MWQPLADQLGFKRWQDIEEAVRSILLASAYSTDQPSSCSTSDYRQYYKTREMATTMPLTLKKTGLMSVHRRMTMTMISVFQVKVPHLLQTAKHRRMSQKVIEENSLFLGPLSCHLQQQQTYKDLTPLG